jgi:ribosomal protein S18 acetylase RimI-like enzyme
MDSKVTLRPATATDGDFLATMLQEAFNWDPHRAPLTLDAVLAIPEVAHYISGWPRPGDVGVIAEILGHPVGAAWVRKFSAAEHGFGYVADDIPELSIAVSVGHRGDGVGTALMHTLEPAVAAAGYHSISLSTERANYAQAWYASLGYRVVFNDRHSDTMLKRLIAEPMAGGSR